MAAKGTIQTPWVRTLQLVVGHAITRAVLSVAIIVSLIPHDWMHANDAVFLLLFLPEFVVRAILASRRETAFNAREDDEGWRTPTGADIFLLLVDFVALLSFLPWAGQSARWLRLFRLTRTVMLLRYWAPLVQDIWSVLRRRERARQLSLMGLVVAMVAFGGTVLLNHTTDEVGEDFDGDGNVGDEHDHKFWVRMYWALRQIEDPGNMLSSPHEIATLVVSIGLTFFGLFLVSFLIGVGTDAVVEIMQLSRLRSSGLKRHTVLVNLDTATRPLLDEVLNEYQQLIPQGLKLLTPRWFAELRKNAKQRRDFVVVGRDEEPPDFMREPQFARIIYRENSDDDDEAFMDRADVEVARRVVVLADTEANEPDDDTVRTLLTIVERLRETVDADEAAHTQLIAEILDEANIGAAFKAIARAQGRVEAHIVPTERLLALFVFSVARRRGAEPLLLELLCSYGHELYSYDYRQAEATDHRVPPLTAPVGEVLESLYWRGLNRPALQRVVPVGILLSDDRMTRVDDAHVVLNPTPDSATNAGKFAGFVGLALNMRVTMDFADEVLANPQAAPPPIPEADFRVPHIGGATTNPLRKVLICGFRPATVNLIEAIITVEPRAEVLILVEDLTARAEALDAFDGHTNLVSSGLLEGVRGTFPPKAGTDELLCAPGDGRDPTGRIVVEVGDWTSSRRLMGLPRGFGTAPDMDLVVMISSNRHGSDATTATALMKLEHLQEHLAGDATRQTVVAELINADLAHRLSRRYTAMGRDNVTVFSIHELRAFFMFQSMVVPNFNLIYGELMAPWGESFVRLACNGGTGVCTFAQLAAKLRMAGRILVAVEIGLEGTKPRLFIGQGDPQRDDQINLAELCAIWVVRTERINEETSRYAAVGDPPAPAAPPPQQHTDPSPSAAPPPPPRTEGTVVGPPPTIPKLPRPK